MFDAVNKTSNDMEFSSSVQNVNQPNCGKNLKLKFMEFVHVLYNSRINLL